ncbi:MAG TPA: type II toxin-antitoxin system HicA family toxin [Ignavibacteria bacterium]|nr:type II toxin-antitoxin system HicA family toxin [Ignavibacteria bacterium]
MVRTKGSHYHLKKGNLLVTVPFHNNELKTGTLKSILQQSNLTIEDLKKVI